MGMSVRDTARLAKILHKQKPSHEDTIAVHKWLRMINLIMANIVPMQYQSKFEQLCRYGYTDGERWNPRLDTKASLFTDD